MSDTITQARTNIDKDSVVRIPLYYYVDKVGSNGWLDFLYENTRVSLPQHTKLQISKEEGSYTLFKVMNGNTQILISGKNIFLKGKTVRLSTKNIDKLTRKKPHIGNGANLILKHNNNFESRANLIFNNNNIEVIFDKPIQTTNITYKIFAPDFPHHYSNHYAKQTKYYGVWFAIEYGDNSRYIHTGSVSDGCVTVPPQHWEALCKYLISNQLNQNDKYVGIIKIIKE